MIRARTGRGVPRPILLFAVLAAFVATACAGVVAPTVGPGSFGTPSATPPATPEPSATGPEASPSATGLTASAPAATPRPSGAAGGCSQSDKNRAFFAKAATSMTWAVYCAVLPDGWFVESGTYSLANGGELEVSYNGPGDAHFAIIEGNACEQFGSDIDACAPRDSVTGQAAFGDQTGELGQLSSALVLDVDRGANPMWRATGLGMSEADFIAICAAMLRVGPSG